VPTSLRLGLAEFRHRPGRALLPGVALIVGVACLLAALALSDAMVRAVGDGGAVVPADVTLQVQPRYDSETVLDQAAANRVAAVPGVQRAMLVRQINVDLLLANGGATGNRATGDVEVDRDGLRRIPIAEGRSPGADGEIAVDRVTAFLHNLQPGSTVQVADAQGKRLDVVVRGITKRGGSGERPLVVVGEDLAAKLDPTPRVLSMQVVGGDQAAVTAAVGGGLAAWQVFDHSPESDDSGDLAAILLPFSILALATAAFVASATFRAVYLQRQRHTALLRCLGATRRPLVVGNLVEALLTGAIAGALGALLGGPVGWLLGRLFDATGVSTMLGAPALDPALIPTTGHLVIGVVVAALLSAFSSVRPSLAAVRVSPLAALRVSEGATPDRAVARRRFVFGMVLVAIAVGLGGLAVAMGQSGQPSIAGIFLVLFSGIAAVAGLFGVLGPVVVPAIGRLFGSVAARFGGAHWKLAAAEVRRVPQRSASVAMPLLLASAMVAFFAVTMGSAQRIEEEYRDRPQPDAVVADVGERPLGDEVDRVASRPEVAGSVVLHTARGSQLDAEGARTPTAVAGVDPNRLRQWLTAQHVTAGGAADFRTGTVLVTPYFLERMALKVGEPVTLDGLPGGARTATVVGTIPGDILDYSDVILADPTLGPATKIVVVLKPGTDMAAYRDAVRAGLPNAPTVLATTKVDRDAEAQRIMDLAMVLMMVLLGLSVAVAVTGIGTALTISVQERRKELALRRALGVTKGGLQGGIVAEAVLLALVGIVGGGVFGLVYAEVTMASMGLLVMPTAALAPLLIGGAGVLVLAVLAAFGPARGASGIKPAAGLASG
jgi:putative ABC transport system permease protein